MTVLVDAVFSDVVDRTVYRVKVMSARDTWSRQHGRAYVSSIASDGMKADTDTNLSAIARQVGSVWPDGTPRAGQPMIYSTRGVFPALDKAWDAFNAKIVAADRAALRFASNVVGGLHLHDTFSRKAGCSCGCSPGFVLKGGTRHDMWVDQMTQDAFARKHGV